MSSPLPELSIIVPVLNDATELDGLLDNLQSQTGIGFEVLVCDGGSSDTLLEVMESRRPHGSYPLRLLQTEPGRGRQMNAGAQQAAGRFLLFLHADSRFAHNDALAGALRSFRRDRDTFTTVLAGRFRLRFGRSDLPHGLAYFYHEAKARLNRGDCIRGDQGFLLERSIFEQLGGYDTTLAYLEDVRLARRIEENGQWLLLPGEIVTSPRRFEQEGFFERQIANVIIVNALETGWNELLDAMPSLYRASSFSGQLNLYQLLVRIRTMISSHDRAWQNAFWRDTGRHVAANAWQLFFWLDVRRAFRGGNDADRVEPRWLNRYLRLLKPVCHTRLASRIARHLTWLWLHGMLYKTGKQSPTKTTRTDAPPVP